ncbi:MAG: NAD+ synthase [Rhodospirillaceae bacterium]|nr:NAD+ synthase [Rhodospirillaceae bacterium]MYH39041.1 NAD+ synthase [Rhodospirillaceae bacterium]MYK12832.1 NAD+ synthase [Rhodospirillaceae bacterium]
MTASLRIAVAQVNPTVGDVDGNAAAIRRHWREAADNDADLVVFPELCLSGYPPEDLVEKPFFLNAVHAEIDRFVELSHTVSAGLLFGTPWADDGRVYNAAVLIDRGTLGVRRKYDLPNYDVFDEKRVFAAGDLPGPVDFRGVRIGIPVCEDVWTPDVLECLAETGAEFVIVLNGSPYEAGRYDTRLQVVLARVRESGLPILYVNQVGGQDELVFDGASFAVNPDYSLAAQLPGFEETVAMTHWRRDGDGWVCEKGERTPPPDGLQSVYQAMVLGLRDYVRKNGFPGVILGLSGGVDSALSAAVAVDALGPDKVWTVMMPSPYTSEESLEDAAAAAALLGVRLDRIDIGPAMDAFGSMLAPQFDGREADETEENIQARSRGLALMAISNKFGHMVLSTGNKSEMSVGYATLYGDMCGGYSVLKDVYKTDVFRLCRWRNQQRPPGALGPAGRVVPERVITKPPSAELRPDQKDEDSLPPYADLDDILHCLIEENMGTEEIVARGHDVETVRRVWKMLDTAEYKRRQAPPGVKIGTRAFGKERRYPITNAFRGQI